MNATHPSLIVENPNNDGDLWIECRDCGACNYLSRGKILHRRRCSARAQYGDAIKPAAAPAAPDKLARFASEVRRTSLTHGRDEDVFQAVRAGLLSENDAMNADD